MAVGALLRIAARGICALAVGAAACGEDSGSSVSSPQSEDGPGDHGTGDAPMAGRQVPPRPLSPLSGSHGGSRQPTFAWTPPRRASVEICSDRDCTHVLVIVDGSDGRARPEAPLPAGVVFWRVVSSRGTSATWELVIPTRDTGTRIAWGTTADFDGDGRADVTIGAPRTDGGSVSIFYGATRAPGFEPDLILSGGPGFGQAVAAIGDVNGDGFGELAVAAGNAPGAVSIFYGAESGFQLGPPLYPGSVSRFGTSMASAGDVNGDGYGDVVVGGVEAAQVFLGGAEGLGRHATLSLAGAPGGSFNGEATVVQGPADVNADGRADLYVGGALYLGNGSGFEPQPASEPFPAGTFVGDHNGDGFVDFTVQGVSPGTPTGIDLRETLFIQAGESVYASAGDFDADGYSDVISILSPLVGAPERDRIYFGAPGACGSTGCRRFLPFVIPGRTPGLPSPITVVATPGDVNGDGTSDLVVTMPESGTASLFIGGSDDPVSFAIRTWTGPAGFGSSIPSLFGTAQAAP